MIENFEAKEAQPAEDSALSKLQSDALPQKASADVPQTVADANITNTSAQESLVGSTEFSPIKLAQAQAKVYEGEACPRSPEYAKIIRKAINNYYAPQNFGDIREFSTMYNCNINSPADAIKWADEALKKLNDPHTDVLTREEVARMDERSRSQFTGLGIGYRPHREITDQSDLPKGPITLTRVFEGSPAEKSGLKSGDVVTAINGTSLDEIQFDKASSLLDGVKNGEAVQLDILRDGNAESIDVTKGVMDLPPVRQKALDGDVTYLAIDSFRADNLVSELQKAVEANKDSKGFIIDLRDNPGGDLHSSIQMASLFVDEGLLMSQIERTPRSDEDDPEYDITEFNLNEEKIDATTYDADFPGLQKFGAPDLERMPDLVDQPVVILVNGRSASASEVFSGALRDNGDAIIMGTKTYGKGIGQTVYRKGMPEGSALSLTTFRYETPSGVWPGDGNNVKTGLTPDIKVEMPWEAIRETESDIQLKAAHDYLLNQQK